MKKILSYIALAVMFVVGFVCAETFKHYYKGYKNSQLELAECKIFLESVKVDETLKEELKICTDSVNLCEEKFSQCIYVVRYLYKQNADLKGEKNGK